MTTPGDIKTIPFDQLWCNAPFDGFLKVRIRLTNGGVRRIGFHLKSTVGPDRIEIDQANGCLDASETTTLWVTIKPFSGADTWSDRVTIEWTDAPASTQHCGESSWATFEQCPVIRVYYPSKYEPPLAPHARLAEGTTCPRQVSNLVRAVNEKYKNSRLTWQYESKPVDDGGLQVRVNEGDWIPIKFDEAGHCISGPEILCDQITEALNKEEQEKAALKNG